MTDEQIVDLFESTNITMQSLSNRTGRPVTELKKLIMSAPKTKILRGDNGQKK